MAQKPSQHFVNGWLKLFERNPLEDLTPDRLVFSKTAANKHVISFEGFASDFYFRAEQPDVAHIMLGAGVRATGEVNVHRSIQLNAFVQIIGEFNGVGFGI